MKENYAAGLLRSKKYLYEEHLKYLEGLDPEKFTGASGYQLEIEVTKTLIKELTEALGRLVQDKDKDRIFYRDAYNICREALEVIISLGNTGNETQKPSATIAAEAVGRLGHIGADVGPIQHMVRRNNELYYALKDMLKAYQEAYGHLPIDQEALLTIFGPTVVRVKEIVRDMRKTEQNEATGS